MQMSATKSIDIGIDIDEVSVFQLQRCPSAQSTWKPTQGEQH